LFGTYLATYPSVGLGQLNPFRRVLAPTFATLPTDPVHGFGILLLRALEFTAAGLGHVSRIITREPEDRKSKRS